MSKIPAFSAGYVFENIAAFPCKIPRHASRLEALFEHRKVRVRRKAGRISVAGDERKHSSFEKTLPGGEPGSSTGGEPGSCLAPFGRKVI